MKHAYRLFVILILISSALYISCSSDTPTVSGEPEDHGSVIAYTYQILQGRIHQINTINEDGTGNQRIIESSIGLNHLDWSPDGSQIACTGYYDSRNSTWSIHVFNADGTGLTRLTTAINVWDTEPRWSPDGSQIAFTRMYPDDNNREEIRIINSDGTNNHNIGIEGNLSGWSPDGTRFIYSSITDNNYEIFSCSVGGTDVQQITTSAEHEVFGCYSPNGNQIVCSTFEGPIYNSNNAPTYEIVVMNSDGSNRRQLTDNDNFDGTCRWSPDGTKFAFTSDMHQTDRWEVYVMNVDGSNMNRVTQSPENVTGINPVWKPVD